MNLGPVFELDVFDSAAMTVLNVMRLHMLDGTLLKGPLNGRCTALPLFRQTHLLKSKECLLGIEVPYIETL